MYYKIDHPIRDSSEDLLNRKPKAQDLAKYIEEIFEEAEKIQRLKKIENQKDPLSTSYGIAIIGSWGEGKTSFINLLTKELKESAAKNRERKKYKDIEIKEFDPWYFPDKCDIHEQFLSLVDNRKSIIQYWLGGYLI